MDADETASAGPASQSNALARHSERFDGRNRLLRLAALGYTLARDELTYGRYRNMS
jgi:hypothetical protein